MGVFEKGSHGDFLGSPSLTLVPSGTAGEPPSIRVEGLDPALIETLVADGSFEEKLSVALRVVIGGDGAPTNHDVEGIAGTHQVTATSIAFLPFFPFDAGVRYFAMFDPRALGCDASSDGLMLEVFSPIEADEEAAAVERIYPSSHELPENLLRFYVDFSVPMQKGRANAEISLRDADGEEILDALYRAPVELWDRGMRRLTVLLDPGRLKRGVGPNRELGPPFKSGDVCVLTIGTGMLDRWGRPIRDAASKRFIASDAVREQIDIDGWVLSLPSVRTVQPVTLAFPRPLDRSLLASSIAVYAAEGDAIEGTVVVDDDERRWRFVPETAWQAGGYQVSIWPGLEDVCGNSVMSAFDRPVRAVIDVGAENRVRSIPFRII